MSMKPTNRDLVAGGVGAVGGIALWEAAKWGWKKFRGQTVVVKEESTTEVTKKKTA